MREVEKQFSARSADKPDGADVYHSEITGRRFRRTSIKAYRTRCGGILLVVSVDAIGGCVRAGAMHYHIRGLVLLSVTLGEYRLTQMNRD